MVAQTFFFHFNSNKHLYIRCSNLSYKLYQNSSTLTTGISTKQIYKTEIQNKNLFAFKMLCIYNLMIKQINTLYLNICKCIYNITVRFEGIQGLILFK